MKKFILSIICVQLSLMGAAQTFLNGSLEGPEGPGTVVPLWTMISPSPDVITIPTGIGITFTAASPTVSPDGGTFQLIYENPTGTYTEEFGQTVSGFTIGETYSVTYYESNFGPCAGVSCYTGDGEILVNVSGVGTFTSGNLLVVSDDWLVGCITFVATAETHTIGFRAHNVSGDGLGSWISIDNPEITVGEGGGDVTEFYYEDAILCFGDDPQLPLIEGDLTGNYSASPAGLSIDPVTGEITPSDSDPGIYTVTYSLGGCGESYTTTVEILGGVAASFDISNICLGELSEFTNTSVYVDGVIVDWEWDFGDGGTSTDESPTHTYVAPGIYEVELIGSVDGECSDTIVVEITVSPVPVCDFEFVINGFSSEDGATGGCLVSNIEFNDLSTVGDPGTITEWDWDFGDGSGSDLENPEHVYGAAGTYTITLIVTTAGGCSSTYELDIVMTEALILDLIFNDPTCFGFTDGSVTVNVTGGLGDLIFEITDADDVVLNEDNSNTANTLGEGWYYFNVSDDSECSGKDSVLLTQPGELEIEIDLTHPLCFGFETGEADITNVINYTGSDDAISYIWNPNPGGNSGLGENETGSMGAGDYTVTINDENGCSKVFDFTITEPTEMFFAEYGFEHAFCRLHEYQSGNGVVFGAAAGGTPDYSYVWTNLDNLDNSINSTWGGLNPGNYELTATDANGCILTQTLFLDSLNPIAAFTVNSDQLNEDCQGTATIQVEFVNQSENYANPFNPGSDTVFFWNLNDPIADWQVSHDIFETFDTVYTPQGSTYYVDVCLVALNKNGCTDTACKEITIYEPIAFEDVNIFTPNGDGINDEFTFEFRSASIEEFNCVIINRWGIIVHEITDINDGWDGTDQNGDPCADGVYFYKYVAKASNATDIIGQGNVQIVTGN